MVAAEEGGHGEGGLRCSDAGAGAVEGGGQGGPHLGQALLETEVPALPHRVLKNFSIKL